jgi:hypothetical protein
MLCMSYERKHIDPASTGAGYNLECLMKLRAFTGAGYNLEHLIKLCAFTGAGYNLEHLMSVCVCVCVRMRVYAASLRVAVLLRSRW